MYPAGFEIDLEGMARFGFAVVVTQAAGVWVVSRVDVPLQLLCEVER
jgi:hypothetical protein